MPTPLRILILEDDPYEAELEITTLEKAGYVCQWERVETRAEFLVCLNRPDYDLILADYLLPTLGGLTALELCRQRGLDLPFIFVSGQPGEEIAIKCLKAGATDYVLKDRLSRLGPAVQRALREKETQRQGRRAEETLAEKEQSFRLLAENAQDTQRQWREEELRILSRAFEQSPGLIMITDTEGNIEYVNPRFTQVTGYTLEEIRGQNPRILKSGKMSPEEYEQLWRTITVGREWRGEFYNKKKSGEFYWASALISPIKDERGVTTHFLAVEEDITDHKQAQEALWQSKERFRQVISSISDHIYVTEVTEDGRHINLYLSPHAEPLTGYPHEKFVTDWSFWPSTVIHPDDREVAAAQAVQLALGRNSEVEYRLVRADGQVIWVRDRARVQSHGTSKITYGLVSDITDYKRAEAEIRKLNEELEQRVADRTRELSALYEVTTVASESLDLETTMERSLERVLAAMRSGVGAIHLLDETEKTLCLAAQQGIRPDIMAEIDPIPSDNSLASWVIEHGEPLVVPDIATDSRAPQVVRTSGLRTYVGVPMRARGRTLGVLSVFGHTRQQFNVEEVALLTSIADQVAVAVENARLRQWAEQAAVMEERERLARELHDSVTQSLYSLTLFAEAGRELVKTEEWEAVGHNFTRIGETAQHGLKEMRLLVHALRPLDLEREGLVGALHRRLNAVEGRVNIKARVVAEELVDLPAPVEEELYRIAQEALNNALKHATITSVTVYLRVEGEWVELEVVDDGTGFDPETVSDKGGMGLINMRKRAEKLGGSLTIISIPGEGTSVKVRVKTPGISKT